MSNNVDKSCKTPVMKIQKIVWSRTRAATTMLLGSIDALFHEFSESFVVLKFPQKVADISWLEVNNFGIPSLFPCKCKGKRKGNVKEKWRNYKIDIFMLRYFADFLMKIKNSKSFCNFMKKCAARAQQHCCSSSGSGSNYFLNIHDRGFARLSRI